MADLLEGGISLLRALELCQTQLKSKVGQSLIAHLNAEVAGGQNLSDALEGHSTEISPFIISLIRAGEQSGSLEQALHEIVRALEREQELKNKVTQSLIYPGIIAGFGIITILVLLLFVVPRLEEMYADFDTALPLLTRCIIALSGLVSTFWWVGLLGLGGLGVYAFLKWERLTAFCGKVLRNTPWFGKLVTGEEAVHFTRTLGLLLGRGVTILEAITVAGKLLRVSDHEKRVKAMHDEIAGGHSLAQAIEEHWIKDPLISSFIRTGEESGSLERSLDRIAHFNERQLERQIKTVTTIIEPVLLLIIGLAVGLLVISMLLPIFEISMLVR